MEAVIEVRVPTLLLCSARAKKADSGRSQVLLREDALIKFGFRKLKYDLGDLSTMSDASSKLGPEPVNQRP